MAFLKPDRTRAENGVVVQEKPIPDSAVWNKAVTVSGKKYPKGSQYKANLLLSNGTGKVAGVTIHNTGWISVAAGTTPAEQYTRATWPNCNMGTTRVHYYVDDAGAWQNLRENEVGWHAADGNYGPGNNTTIALEIIMDGTKAAYNAKAEDNGARLAAAILVRHGLTIDNIYTHNHWIGKPDKEVNDGRKNCPAYILPHWDAFKAKVQQYMEILQPIQVAPTTDTIYRVQVGAYRNKDNARELVAKLAEAGFNAFIADGAAAETDTMPAADYEELADKYRTLEASVQAFRGRVLLAVEKYDKGAD